jgi:uncharacterized protein
MASATLLAIYRYPVKGLSPESLARTKLSVGQTIKGDRSYAIENGPSGFNTAAPVHLPKSRFLTLMRNERLAKLRADFDEGSQILTVKFDGGVVRGDLTDSVGRIAIEAFFARYCAGTLQGPPKVLSAGGHSFSDVAGRVVSIINVASVAVIEKAVGARVNPLRFRGNIYMQGWPAWHELDLVGREIGIGPTARIRLLNGIPRCAATNVDPQTGIRDLTIPSTLMRAFNHTDCGVYGEVVADGDIAVGNPVYEAAQLCEAKTITTVEY